MKYYEKNFTNCRIGFPHFSFLKLTVKRNPAHEKTPIESGFDCVFRLLALFQQFFRFLQLLICRIRRQSFHDHIRLDPHFVDHMTFR